MEKFNIKEYNKTIILLRGELTNKGFKIIEEEKHKAKLIKNIYDTNVTMNGNRYTIKLSDFNKPWLNWFDNCYCWCEQKYVNKYKKQMIKFYKDNYSILYLNINKNVENKKKHWLDSVDYLNNFVKNFKKWKK